MQSLRPEVGREQGDKKKQQRQREGRSPIPSNPDMESSLCWGRAAWAQGTWSCYITWSADGLRKHRCVCVCVWLRGVSQGLLLIQPCEGMPEHVWVSPFVCATTNGRVIHKKERAPRVWPIASAHYGGQNTMCSHVRDFLFMWARAPIVVCGAAIDQH